MARSSSWFVTSAAAAVAALAVAAASVWLVSRTSKKRDRVSWKSESSSGEEKKEEREEEEEEEDVSPPPPIREVNVASSSSSSSPPPPPANQNSKRRILTRGSVTIVHGSVTGTCERFAKQLHAELLKGASASSSPSLQVQIASAEDFDWWDELINDDEDENEGGNDKQRKAAEQPPALLVLLLPTYTDGTWSPPSEPLATALDELLTDWRIAKFPLKGKLTVAAFGMGSSEYGGTGPDGGAGNMGKPAKEAVRRFQRLGARCVSKVRVGDDAVGNHAQDTFDAWRDDLVNCLLGENGKAEEKKEEEDPPSAAGSCACKDTGNGDSTKLSSSDGESTPCCQQSGGGDASTTNNGHAADSYDDDDEDSYGSQPSDDEDDGEEPEIMDVEDLGDTMMASQAAATATKTGEPREMVTPSQAVALKKEGYKLIGTHSAVKLCRWTKHQLRGRGGCYKHTFYGITSYQCMEATPSLACANKCVFCWRHHKNPVGKEWRWKTDDPHFIVEQAVQEHVRMIKETKGIPGVRVDRWKEAHTVLHCALSLVGEPIMYPRIDELLGDLHGRKISTFLVTNGQHPEAIETIRPITQLYVSVDAPTKKSLIEIDRPLFNDAWERLQRSLSSLKNKGQRTVARLTVVKGWNSDEVAGYARMIALGRVSLVEVKGVTFCGKSDASNLNMTNTPWHHEVVELTRTLKVEIDKLRAQRLREGDDDIPPEYGLACEHKHSLCVLLARVDQFAEDDPISGKRTWKTWIDYERFHELAARNAADPSFSFSVDDYTAETPPWALFGSDEEGFDPTDARHRKKTKHPKYVKFDADGIPTHDHNSNEVGEDERRRLVKMMEAKLKEIGSSGSTVTELKGGEKEVLDASLMFRGLVVTK